MGSILATKPWLGKSLKRPNDPHAEKQIQTKAHDPAEVTERPKIAQEFSSHTFLSVHDLVDSHISGLDLRREYGHP